MMKSLALELQCRELEVSELNEIQGLYPFKNSSQSFWTLKAKIELAVFKEHKKGEKQQ